MTVGNGSADRFGHASLFASGRALAAIVLLALFTTVLPPVPGAADASVPTARGIDRVCPPPSGALVANLPALNDLDGSVHRSAVVCAAGYGLVDGFTDGTYRPARPVNRGQMASFVLGWIEAATDIVLPPPVADPFPDIAGTFHRDAIATLARFEVLAGRSDGTFGPGEVITRGQMARFVANAIDFADNPGVAGTRPEADDTPYFADVVGSFFQADIQSLAGIGIVQGDPAGAYRAGDAVTRGQLATFLMRSADFLDREQRWAPTATDATYEVALAPRNVTILDPATGQRTYGAGDPAASGTATLAIDAFGGSMEVTLEFDEVSGAFGAADGAAIHLGAVDENGPIVVPIATGTQLQNADEGRFETTVFEADADVRFADLIEDAPRFYVQIASDLYPDGVVRGQLPDGGQDLVPGIATFPVVMTGAQQLAVTDDGGLEGEAGEPGASATVQLTVDAASRVLRYDLDLTEVTGPFADASGLHLHRGEAGTIGSVVLQLATGAELDAAVDGRLTGTVSEAEAGASIAFAELLADPAGYYLDVHSDAYRGGAVRGQLR
jgi:hypothetical protein